MSRSPYRRRPPYRSRQKLGFAETMWLIIFGAIIGATIFYSTPDAHSDPGTLQIDPQAATYAVSNAYRICAVIGEYPSAAGVAGVIAGITEDGLTGGQAGQAIAIAVTAQCPQMWPVLEKFVTGAAPRTPSSSSVAGVAA
jgi:hypothetical protein